MDTTTSTDREGHSRRDFLKSSTAVVGAGMAAQLLVPKLAHADGAGGATLKVGLIGCGGRGAGAAQNVVQADEDCQLVAIADAFDDRIQERRSKMAQASERLIVADEMCFSGFDAYRQLLATDVDVIILATPPHFRPEHFRAAIEAGKHVFMEKPVAVDAPGVRQVIETAKQAQQSNRCVGVGLQRRHQLHYREAISRLKDGAIGDVILSRVYWNGGGVWVRGRASLEKRYGRPITEMEYQMRNWYYFNWLCGDHIVEQHIHNLDVVNWLKDGFPVEANGMGGREVRKGKDHGEIFDHHFVEFTYADGSKMMSQCRHIRDCWNSVSEHFHGTRGTARLSHDYRYARIDGDEAWRYSGESPNPYLVEHQDLFAAIRSGSPYNEAEYGAKSTMTAIFGRMATYSGKSLLWDEAINSDISLSPKQYDFQATPPVVPDAEGNYPIPVPGVTRVV